MRIYRLQKQTSIPASLEVVWEYFSKPENLNDLTPPDLTFKILTDTQGLEMSAGMIIQYEIQPLPFLNFSWVTEITHCTNHQSFVDEQRFGPYAFWHHEHRFESTEEGVLMSDTVHYAIGWGWIGACIHNLWVKKKLEHIFSYREGQVLSRFR